MWVGGRVGESVAAVSASDLGVPTRPSHAAADPRAPTGRRQMGAGAPNGAGPGAPCDATASVGPQLSHGRSDSGTQGAHGAAGAHGGRCVATASGRRWQECGGCHGKSARDADAAPPRPYDEEGSVEDMLDDRSKMSH